MESPVGLATVHWDHEPSPPCARPRPRRQPTQSRTRTSRTTRRKRRFMERREWKRGRKTRPRPSKNRMSDRLHITVMLGGPSAEREVSLQSGAAVVKALRSLGHSVDQLDPRDDSWTLAAGTEAVFLALHGNYGEDGTVQRHLEALGLPYTGCDSEASRIAF